MADLCDRLRRWTHAADAQPASDIMDEAADEIERLNREVSILIAECQRLQDRCVNGPSA